MQSRHFSKVRAGFLILVAILVVASFSLAQATPTSGCLPGEGVFFSCQLEGNQKVVSLCTAPNAAAFQSITYRYGFGAKYELTYLASVSNQNRFLATVSPASPGASVRQVWFEMKGTRYVVTSCVGGGCSHPGGIIVLRAGKVLMRRACANDSAHPYFAEDVVRFGSDPDNSRSSTDLIKFEDYDNSVNTLYPAHSNH